MNGFTARRFGRTAAAALAVASLTALAACGGGDDDKAAGAGGKGAATAPKATATATATTGTTGSPLSGTAHGTAALDLVEKATEGAHSARVSSETWSGDLRILTTRGVMDWSHGITGDLTMDFTSGDMAQSMADEGMPARMRILYLRDHFYMNMGDGAAAEELGGKHWVGFSLKEMSQYGGGSAATLVKELQGASPTAMVATLLTLPAMKDLGPVVIDGTPTTHYQDVVTGGKTGLAKSGISGGTFDLYLAKNNLPIRISLVQNTVNGRTKTVTTYSDYGVAVHPQAPPAFDVASLEEAVESED